MAGPRRFGKPNGIAHDARLAFDRAVNDITSADRRQGRRVGNHVERR